MNCKKHIYGITALVLILGLLAATAVAQCPIKAPCPAERKAEPCPKPCPEPCPKPCPKVCPTPCPSSNNIIEAATAAGNFKTLLSALEQAGLTETLKSCGSYTVFAPTDAAFAKLGKCELDNLFMIENREKLAEILKYHVVDKSVFCSDIVDGQRLRTLNGQYLTMRVGPGSMVTVNCAMIRGTDIRTGNGVIHVIDTVLIPK